MLRLHQRRLLEVGCRPELQDAQGDESIVFKIGVLVSGRGSNLEAILRAIEQGEVRGARVAVVVSNKPGVRALDIASRHGIPSVVVSGTGAERAAFDEKLLEALAANDVLPGSGLILLAGFMKVLSARFVHAYAGRILNIHPSLLPSFPGLDAQEQALEYGVKVAGCTVHFVVSEVDAGPIVMQAVVPVRGDDTVASLSARILRKEHAIYPRAVKLFVEGKLEIEGRRVTLRP